MGVSSVCVEEGERRSEEELGRSVGRRSVVGRRSAGAAPKVRTPNNDVGNYSFKSAHNSASLLHNPGGTLCHPHFHFICHFLLHIALNPKP